MVGRGILKSMDPSTVIIIKWPKPFKTRYFRNLLPDLQISLCKCCLKVSFIEKKRYLIRKILIEFLKVLYEVLYNCYVFQLFHSDDYELALLRHGHCPFCRTPNVTIG